eukprot:scpid63899/ scgid12219/ 
MLCGSEAKITLDDDAPFKDWDSRHRTPAILAKDERQGIVDTEITAKMEKAKGDPKLFTGTGLAVGGSFLFGLVQWHAVGETITIGAMVIPMSLAGLAMVAGGVLLAILKL